MAIPVSSSNEACTVQDFQSLEMVLILAPKLRLHDRAFGPNLGRELERRQFRVLEIKMSHGTRVMLKVPVAKALV